MFIGAPFVPTTNKHVKEMLELADLKTDDILMDLGSGDGRFLKIASPKCKKCIGIEINPILYWWSKIKLSKIKNITILREDLWKTNLNQTDVIMLYFIQSKMEKLKAKILKEMKPGARVISYGFSFPNWQPETVCGKIRLYRI